jgi:DNA replication and repair protein RecF
MHLKELRLRDFRNYTALDAVFQPGFHLFLGDNGQGKSNLLEAIYLLSTLKSFRGVPNSQLVRAGQKGYFVGGVLVGERENHVKTYWSARERNLVLNGRRIARTEDIYGTIRAVVFCAEDMLLIKGGPQYRRRYMDFLLAQTDSAYLTILQRYGLALRSRNAALKTGKISAGVLEGFSRELVACGTEIIRRRSDLVQIIRPTVCLTYEKIANQKCEEVQCYYRPNVEGDFSVELAQSRQRELAQRYTVVGPHRDDLDFLMNGVPVLKQGSEGQKRTWALALKMAQAEYLTQVHGVLPVLLIDDVMGELDQHRRQAFLPLLSRVASGRGQMFMTCTSKNWSQELDFKMTEWSIQRGQLFPSRRESSP